MRTEPSPWATWESEPAPAHDPVLAREPLGLLVERADRHARVVDLDRVDVVEDRQQVLVVGHRVHPVERMGDVDQAALALDLGDVSCSVIPRGIFSLMNRPMTSPCSAVLTSSATMTFTPKRSAFPAASSAPGDLVVVGDRDRAEPLLAGGGQQHLDRRGAVVGVVGVHVQVDVDELAPARAARRIAGVARRGWRRATRLAVDARRSSATRSQRQPRAQRVRAVAQPLAQRRRRRSAGELGGQRPRCRRARTAGRAPSPTSSS